MPRKHLSSSVIIPKTLSRVVYGIVKMITWLRMQYITCFKRYKRFFWGTGWSPRGTTPSQVTKFHRDQRYQILPAYAQDGIVLSCIYQGPTDSSLFKDFIEELLHYCGKWPEPKSVLVMDNASFHHSESIEQMCSQAGVKLVYLPPYSLDLSPIEELFAELKAFIRRHWQSYEENPDQGFNTFLEWCCYGQSHDRYHVTRSAGLLDDEQRRYEWINIPKVPANHGSRDIQHTQDMTRTYPRYTGHTLDITRSYPRYDKNRPRIW